MRVLITGSRDWTDSRSLERALDASNVFKKPITVIVGGARGVDTLAFEIAKKRSYAVKIYRADWKKYGLSAGSIRNATMLLAAKPDIVLAFPLGESKGTRDMIGKAMLTGVRVREWVPEGRGGYYYCY